MIIPAGRDVLLGLLAVAVLAGAVDAVRVGGEAAPRTEALRPAAAPDGPAPAAPTATPSSVPAAGPVLLVGPDLAPLARGLADGLGSPVVTAPAAPPAVLADGALAAVAVEPAEVVLQVLAGSRTTTRTAAALQAVAERWPRARVLVVGPFGAQDRLSTAAVAAAAQAAGAVFVDPVALGWRAGSGPADRVGVARGLVSALR